MELICKEELFHLLPYLVAYLLTSVWPGRYLFDSTGYIAILSLFFVVQIILALAYESSSWLFPGPFLHALSFCKHFLEFWHKVHKAHLVFSESQTCNQVYTKVSWILLFRNQDLGARSLLLGRCSYFWILSADTARMCVYVCVY